MDDHGVAYVKIEGDSHFVACICGWRSDVRSSEAEATADLEAHIEAVTARG